MTIEAWRLAGIARGARPGLRQLHRDGGDPLARRAALRSKGDRSATACGKGLAGARAGAGAELPAPARAVPGMRRADPSKPSCDRTGRHGGRRRRRRAGAGIGGIVGRSVRLAACYALAALDLAAFWLPNLLTGTLAVAGLATGLIGICAGDGRPADRRDRRLRWRWPRWRRGYRVMRGRHGLGGGDPKLFGAIGLLARLAGATACPARRLR